MQLPEDIHRDWSSLHIQRAAISTGVLAAAGTATLISGVTKRTGLIALVLVPTGACIGLFRSGATAISGVIQMNPTTPLILPPSEVPWFQTATGQALTLLNGTASMSYSGFALYVEKD